MFRRFCGLFALALLALTIACSGNSPTSPTPTPSPTPSPSPAPAPAPSPSPSPAPAPTTVSLTGFVRAADLITGISGATVSILDGVNAGRSATTTSTGAYSFTGLTAGNGNLSATAAGYEESRTGVNINGTNTANFTLRTVTPWSRSGSGDDVWSKPSYVTRVTVTGSFSGFSSNFIMYCGTSLLVNELLGTGWSTTSYRGTLTVSSTCTEMSTRSSNGVSWTVTEAR